MLSPFHEIGMAISWDWPPGRTAGASAAGRIMCGSTHHNIHANQRNSPSQPPYLPISGAEASVPLEAGGPAGFPAARLAIYRWENGCIHQGAKNIHGCGEGKKAGFRGLRGPLRGLSPTIMAVATEPRAGRVSGPWEVAAAGCFVGR